MNFLKFSRIFKVNVCKFCAGNVRRISQNTIFSLSSGHGKCGVSVIRVSGPNTFKALKALTADNFDPKPRYAHLKSFRHPITGDILDRGIILWFPGPSSFTGEDCCEFQIHGSIAVVEAMYDALRNVPGLRTAKPGEFTKRAFFCGKLDLTEVEGLADLIHAETEAQRRQAFLQSTGNLSKLYKNWRQRIIRCVAHMEAYIDFAEDENIEDNVIENLKRELKILIIEMKEHLNDQRQGEMLRNGVRTVIVGEPNVGKSSFLNLICQKQISIVTSIAGTTRDVIESSYNIGGYPVVLADTAGLRENTEDVIEAEGIQRALDCIRRSDLIILIVDVRDFIAWKMRTANSDNRVDDYRNEYLKKLGVNEIDLEDKKIFMIANKLDLLDDERRKTVENLSNLISISCKENLNITELLSKLTTTLEKLCGRPNAEHPRVTNSRYRQNIKECVSHLEDFLDNYDPKNSYMTVDYAIAAQILRLAVKCIEQITGEVRTDEILDVIFKDFCIGK